MKVIYSFLLLFTFFSCQGQEVPPIETIKEHVKESIYPKIDAIILEQDDRLIIEEYYNGFNKNSLHDTRSSFKSITSLLAGIAIDQKLFSVSDSIYRFFPELKNQPKGNITVQNLLEMRSGLNCEEFYEVGPVCEGDMVESDDWIAYCLNVEQKHLPGLNWSYNSNEPMLVGEIISRVSGMTIMEFAKKYLFNPLGIKDYQWTLSPKGKGMTAGSFFMRPIDMLKVAQLVFNNGKWDDQQIVSAEWIKKSTTCEIDIDFSFTRYSRMQNAKYKSARYGFFWYREPLEYQDIKTEVLFASGNGGQYMMLLPDYNAKVVFTGSNYGNWRGKLPFEILLKHLIPLLEKN